MKKLKRQLNILKSNQGFTLIELIVASLVSVIVIISLVAIISVGLNQYRIIDASTSLQQEMQLVQNQLGEIIMESSYLAKAGTPFDGTASDDGIIDMVDTCYFLKLENDNLCLIFDSLKHRLLLANYTSNEDTQVPDDLDLFVENVVNEMDKYLFAENVYAFEINVDERGISNEYEDRLIKTQIVMETGGKTLTSEKEYKMRNGKW